MSDINEASLLEKFIIARWMYGIGKPIISDADYTLLLSYMHEKHPDSIYLKQSWSNDECPTELLKKYGLENATRKFEMLDKTESIPSLNSYSEIANMYSNYKGVGTASMKHDGWNIQLEYNSGRLQSIHSRGRKAASVNEYDALRSRVPNTINIPGPIRIVTEATVSYENFPLCQSHWGSVNTRTAVASVLANPGHEHLIDLHAFAIHGVDLAGKNKFEVLESLGFKVPKWYIVKSYEDILEAVNMLSEDKEFYKSPTDGVVVDNGESLRAIRVKAWEEQIFKSYVVGYIEEYSSHRITPKIAIRPIVRDGVTQRVLPMTNWKRIFDNNLQVGSPVAFRVVSDAIADFDAESTRVLQDTWQFNYDEYHRLIDEEEEFKKCQSTLSV